MILKRDIGTLTVANVVDKTAIIFRDARLQFNNALSLFSTPFNVNTVNNFKANKFK